MSFDEEHRGEHEECAHRIAELERLLKDSVRQYHLLVLWHQEERDGTAGERQRSFNLLNAVVRDLDKLAEEKRKMRRLYRKRLTRLYALLRERKSVPGYLISKLRRMQNHTKDQK